MDVKKLKQYIYENNKTEYILEEIGCHHIRLHSNYYACANYNGDNIGAVQVYIDTEFLKVVNHTRTICDISERASLIDLVVYNKELSLFHAIKYLCDILGLDYYEEDKDDLPESLKITRMLLEMQKGIYEEEDISLKPISEAILGYYKPYVNDMFAKDGISYATQQLFEIGYDDETNAITIPIRDEIGNLVGVKGRFFDYTLETSKYIYIEKCAKSKILYGLDKSYKYIKQLGYVIVTEAEKGHLQLHDMGIYNGVSVSGKKVSKIQAQKLSSLGVKIILAFDSDVDLAELKGIAKSFMPGVEVFAMIDNEGILAEKESPSDDPVKFEKLMGIGIINLKK
ncbi:MAG: hypothetical protein RR370_02795 [Synergistaceae bacterium]